MKMDSCVTWMSQDGFSQSFDQQVLVEDQQSDIDYITNGKAYAIHVAKLGGYLDRGSDPPPGWQTMWKGLQKLRMWAEGYELAAE